MPLCLKFIKRDKFIIKIFSELKIRGKYDENLTESNQLIHEEEDILKHVNSQNFIFIHFRKLSIRN